MEFDRQLKFQFIEEAQDLTEEAERILLKASECSFSQPVREALFRHYHTLKGSSLAVGFNELGRYIHKVEEVISRFEEFTETDAKNIFTLILSANDIISDWIEETKEDFEYVDQRHFQSANRLNEMLGRLEKIEDQKIEAFGLFDDPPKNQPTLLIVDDELDQLETLQLLLEPYNLCLQTASSVSEALDIKNSRYIDLIITDFYMSEGGGIALIEAIRKHDQITPIAVISGATSKADLTKLFSMGISGYIEKPYSLNVLINLIHSSIFSKRLRYKLKEASLINFHLYLKVYQILKYPNSRHAGIENKVGRYLEDLLNINNDILTLSDLSIFEKA